VQVRREAVPRESGKRDLACMPAYIPNRHSTHYINDSVSAAGAAHP
jgi:hypothetical protein